MNKQRLSLLVAIILVLTTLITPLQATDSLGAEMIANGSFESADLDNWWLRVDWNGGTWQRVTTGGRSNSAALMATGQGTGLSSENAGVYYTSQEGNESTLQLDGGSTYRLTFWVKRDTGVTSNVYMDVNEGALGSASATKTGEFEQLTVEFVAPSTPIKLRCVANALKTGQKVWLDDVSLRKVSTGYGENLVPNGSFELGSGTSATGWNQDARWTRVGAENGVTPASGSSMMKVLSTTTALTIGTPMTVKANTYYEYSCKIYRKSLGGTAYCNLLNSSQADIAGTQIGTETVANEWYEISLTFYTGNNTTIYPRCVVDNTSTSLTGQAVYFDDIQFREVLFDPAPTSLVTNGSFEDGSGTSATGWNQDTRWTRVGAQGSVTPADGDYMLRAVATSTGICIGSPMTVKPNTYYNYTAKLYRSDLQGTAYFNLLDSNQADIPGTQMGKDVAGEWVEVSQVFYSGDRTTVYPRCVVDNALSGAPMYFDDIKFIEIDWDDNKAFPVGVTLSDVDAVYQIGSANTKATIKIANDNHYITSLTTGATGATQWVSEAIRVPLVNVVNSQSVDWQYVTSSLNSITNGQELKIEFASPDGALKLNAYWTARSGVGPIEYRQEILSNTQSVSVKYADAVSANFRMEPDGDATLYRFSRSRVNDGSDPYFSQGILPTELSFGSQVLTSVENYYTPVGSILPFQMVDVDGDHGFYIGHYWSFGKILVRMNNEGNIGVTTYLDDSTTSSITRSAGTAIEIPGFFIGTYEGDLDDGSNDMKNWFWDYKITRSLYNNSDEPMIEADIMIGTAADFQTVVNLWPDIEDYIRVVKMDYPWTVPDGYAARQDVVTEDKWLPDATKYPNGHNLWSAIRAHSPNMRFALYMADTYQGVDIGTEYGRNLQIQALKERFRPTNNDYGLGFDYWRSDFNVEASHDYDSHEGLLEILDTMIDYSSDFRYEHCMGGGTLKEFTTLERMTFMTTEDTALPLNHRMSLYANSYMIHPVQLKADLNMTYTSRDYGALTGYGNILTSGQQCWTSEEYSKYALRTGMMGASMLAFPHQALVQHNAMIETHHDLYNQVQRPILRDCNVYHILPSPTGWTYADWDGIQYYNENIDKGVVMLFKENTTAPNSKTIVLKGLDANTSYTLTFIDRTAQNCVKTGAELMSTGINVTGMTEQYDSELIYIEPVQQS